MAGIYKSGVVTVKKAWIPTNVEIAAAFAAQMIHALHRHAKVLRTLEASNSVPKSLYIPIQNLYGIVLVRQRPKTSD